MQPTRPRSPSCQLAVFAALNQARIEADAREEAAAERRRAHGSAEQTLRALEVMAAERRAS